MRSRPLASSTADAAQLQPEAELLRLALQRAMDQINASMKCCEGESRDLFCLDALDQLAAAQDFLTNRTGGEELQRAVATPTRIGTRLREIAGLPH